MCIVFSELMLSVPSLPLQRLTWMTTSPLTARPHPPRPRLNTHHTTASSHNTRPLPPPHPSMTRLRHVVPRSQLTAAFTTSPAATPRTQCCSQSQPPPLRPIRTAGTALSSMSSTRPHGRPQWRHRCATFPSVMTSPPHLVQTVPTRCLALPHCRWE